jgi:hypothetical protein
MQGDVARCEPVASSRAVGWFCANEGCVLHVRAGDRAVVGCGEWAVRTDGIVTSRRWVAGRVVCDVCAVQAARVSWPGVSREEGGR